MSEAELQVTDRADEAVRRQVLQALIAHNAPFLGPPDFRPLDVLAREGGRLVAALVGETGRGLFHVELLWVAEGQRGRGLGRRLLEAAEAEAAARGCRMAWLDTYEFQARPFYERQGYELFGTLGGATNGHRRFYLAKRLAVPPAPLTP